MGPGGPYEGYQPVFQGDNAGPHNDGEYLNFCETACEERGWLWEPQAPQMPHGNACDLGLFPSMSKRHSDLLREKGGQVATLDEIWDAALKVWKNYELML